VAAATARHLDFRRGANARHETGREDDLTRAVDANAADDTRLRTPTVDADALGVGDPRDIRRGRHAERRSLAASGPDRVFDTEPLEGPVTVTRSTALVAVGLTLFLAFATPAAASLPTISYSIEGIPGTNGWYRGSIYGDNVVLHWSVSNEFSTTCLAAVPILGPTTGTTESCSATNNSGTATVVTPPIKIDDTPPAVTATFSRKPDSNGWYNHPVTIRWSGTDATSGIAGCSTVAYSGPYNAAATVSGGCTDMAGNTAVHAVRLAYDATPPVLRQVSEDSTATANILRWSPSNDSDRIVVRRTLSGDKAHKTVFNGRAGRFTDTTIRAGAEYVYSVQAFDQAGNSSRVITVTGLPKVLTLQGTGHVPRAAPNPILRWGRIRGAGYYNVQLFRGSKRIYAAWPSSHQVGLRGTWKWAKHRFRLTPGRYRWYVWAGLGARRLARYRTVGSASFIMPRS
jgi:hypothetical protein